jgi:hypothetical protein
VELSVARVLALKTERQRVFAATEFNAGPNTPAAEIEIRQRCR